MYDKYLEDGVDPVKRRDNTARSSQFKGVSWSKASTKWMAQCKGAYLGLHATEMAAAAAYKEYVEDGVVPEQSRRGNGRGAATSQFMGVCWHKSSGRGLHWFPFPLNLSKLCPSPLNLSKLCPSPLNLSLPCPPYDPNEPVYVS